MKRIFSGVYAVGTLISAVLIPGAAWATPYAPTSVEVVYQPTYSMATGGPTSQLSLLGGGIRLGYAMTSLIAFELGGYYDGYVFGGVNGADQTAYAARATGDFALVPAPYFRVYLGADANVFFNPPAALTWTGTKDLGIIGGLRIFIGGPTKLFLGAEYRYALATQFTYSGGSINTSALMGNLGLHFGGM